MTVESICHVDFWFLEKNRQTGKLYPYAILVKVCACIYIYMFAMYVHRRVCIQNHTWLFDSSIWVETLSGMLDLQLDFVSLTTIQLDITIAIYGHVAMATLKAKFYRNRSTFPPLLQECMA